MNIFNINNNNFMTNNTKSKPKLLVNGKEIELDGDSVKIEISGDLSFFGVECKGSVTIANTDNFAVQINGNVGQDVSTENGNVQCETVGGNVSTENGNVKCQDVKGFCKTQNGKITCGNVGGNVSTDMGSVECGDVAGSVKTSMGNIRRK